MNEIPEDLEPEFVNAYLGEPVGKEVELLKRHIKNRLFTRDELSGLLRSIEGELDGVVERLGSGEFFMIFYNLTLRRADNGHRIGGILERGSDLSLGEAAKRFSLRRLRDEEYGGYKSTFKKAVIEHDYSVPINSEMIFVGYRDKITQKIPALNPRERK